MVVMKRAQELRAQGRDLVDFGIGEPDFPTPEHVKRAGSEAIAQDFTKYTAAGGIPELKEAVALHYERDYGASYDPQREIIITCGSKHALYQIAMALLGPGDEVVLPTPYWVTYPAQIQLAGARMVTVDTREEVGFALTAREVEGALTPRTKAVLLNFPNNPSGATIAPEELRAIIELARSHDSYVIYDECYDRFSYEEPPLSAARFGVENVIVTGSCSKTYAMTGWRIGWAAGPADVIKAMEKIQSQSTSNPTSIAQKAAITALTGDQGCVAEMIAEYRRRRDVLVRGLDEIPGICCPTPKGAFYAFPNVKGLFSNGVQNTTDLAAHLVEEAGVVTVPGAAFGRDEHLRFSYATSMEQIERGLDRLHALFR
jgi:aspartate aminotransferase